MESYDIIFSDYKEGEKEKNQNKKLIEYYLVNMPDSITKGDPRNFIKTLINSSDLELYETLPIQTIVTFKWGYTKMFFIRQLLIFLLYIIALVTDLCFFSS